ncbi:hypothetical protein BURMUCF2_B0309 [Burkholderia multivorans CF2]|nr:hypothetical protein BURMUCF2_B0309 [Burkholderia multivorans CF2]
MRGIDRHSPAHAARAAKPNATRDNADVAPLYAVVPHPWPS